MFCTAAAIASIEVLFRTQFVCSMNTKISLIFIRNYPEDRMKIMSKKESVSKFVVFLRPCLIAQTDHQNEKGCLCRQPFC